MFVCWKTYFGFSFIFLLILFLGLFWLWFIIVQLFCEYEKLEEELKRLQQETNGSSYSQVGFSYDQSQQIGPSREEFSNSPTCEEAEQAFQLPYNFQVPEGMQLPETMKQHAIIEKTARFIASQGVQMEILLKAKQSNNVQFEFLSQNSTLNPYYKYVINSIKDGTYPQHTETKDKDKKETDNANGNSLASAENIVQKPVVTVPTIKYKPSADCAYTQLISKIKGVPLSELHDESSRHSFTSQHESANNSPSLTPVLLQYNGATFVTEQDDNSNSNMATTQNSGEALNDSQPKVEILKNSSALALAQNYSSDSETEDETAEEEKDKTPPKLEFPLPPESLQNIIDKTAVYVIKNGRQFEETLRSKSVERFTFLLPDNEYYPYYMYKITGDPNAASKEQKKRKAKEVAEALLSKKGLNGDKTTAATTNPVSFSIKTKDEASANVPLPQPALPQEHSDEEDKPKSNTNNTSSSAQRHVPEHVQKAIQLVESQLMARNAQLAATLALRQPSLATGSSSNTIKSLPTRYETDKLPTKLTNPTVTVATSSTSNTSKAEAERNAIFEQQQQQRHKELKKAEEKVKDKLAQIAREKLGGLISKEKQLQLERKRKAMAFLNQIKGVSKTDNNSEDEPPKKSKTNNEDNDNNSDDSDVSVHSIPITSYGPNSDDELEEKLENKIITPTPPSPPHITAKTKELIQHKTSATVNVSDDDEVELISEIKPREMFSKRRSRSRSKDILLTAAQTRRHYRKHEKRTPSTESILSSNNEEDEEEDEEEDDREGRRSHRSKSKSHKSKKSKSKKSSKSKKKSKKRSRSKSRTRSRSRSRSHHRHHSERHRHRSRSHSYAYDDDYYKQANISERERDREQRKRSSHTPSRSNYSSYSRSHKDKIHRYD